MKKSTKKQNQLAAIRTAVANYIHSEGCGCCRGLDHNEHQATLGKILRVKRYPDGSGYDFDRYRTKE